VIYPLNSIQYKRDKENLI